VGFSRGAFTARSVAGMIGDLGLLTRSGMEYFYPIFKDMENWQTPGYKDPFPNMPFSNKPKGRKAAEAYRNKLLEKGYTRVYKSQSSQGNSPELRAQDYSSQKSYTSDSITVKAVAVWDTVGSLGIPNIGWLSKILPIESTKEFRFYNTDLSPCIEHAFQALALDEERPPFSPAVWERTRNNHGRTELRQVWFPGNHGGVGGGWADTGVANLSFVWMMDQLTSIGVEFDELTIQRLADDLESYYLKTSSSSHSAPFTPQKLHKTAARHADRGSSSGSSSYGTDKRPLSGTSTQDAKCLPLTSKLHWAIDPIYSHNVPIRPWGLGQTFNAASFIYKLFGSAARTPGLYHRVDKHTAQPTRAWLQDTNERVHSSVRVRLALKGLGLDDKAVWECKPLTGRWKLRSTKEQYDDPVPGSRGSWGSEQRVTRSEVWSNGRVNGPNGYANGRASGANESLNATFPLEGARERWIWVYDGPEDEAPPERILVEDPLGPYERQFLKLAAGDPNVFKFVEDGRHLTRRHK
jgi:uncharacterized protein (DUF2235 family)